MGGGGLCGARDGAASLRGSGLPAPIRDLGAQRRWRASRPRASLASCWPWASRPSHLSLPVIGGWGTGDGCALDPPTRWPAGAQDPGGFRSSRAADRRTHGRPPGLTRLLSGSVRSAPTSSPSSAWRSLCPSPPAFRHTWPGDRWNLAPSALLTCSLRVAFPATALSIFRPFAHRHPQRCHCPLSSGQLLPASAPESMCQHRPG